MSSKTKNKKGLSWPPTQEDLEKAEDHKAAPAAKVSKKKQKTAAPVCIPPPPVCAAPAAEKKRGRKKKVVEAPLPVDPGSKRQKKQKKRKKKDWRVDDEEPEVSRKAPGKKASPAARGKKEIVLTPGELAMWKAKGGWIAAVFSWAFFVTFWLLGVI